MIGMHFLAVVYHSNTYVGVWETEAEAIQACIAYAKKHWPDENVPFPTEDTLDAWDRCVDDNFNWGLRVEPLARGEFEEV